MLAEYRKHRSIDGWFLVDPAGYGEDLKPLRGKGPDLPSAGPKVEDIDWAGFEKRVELWENNAGGLVLVARWEGATIAGYCGFETAQNRAMYRAQGRKDITFALDAAWFATEGEIDGSVYEPIAASAVEELDEHRGETNAALLVATWTDGRIEICAPIGAAARWYLDADAPGE